MTTYLNTTTPTVTVVLTSFNHGKYIRDAIDSVLNQTFSDFELIIWDDSSIDDSWGLIKSYSDNRIRAYRNDSNKRYTINNALQVARGKYIAIIHSDDIWEENKLGLQLEYLEKHTEIGAVFTQTSTIGEDNKPLFDEKHHYNSVFDQPNRTRYEWLNYFFYNGNALCHPSVVIRKECYEKCGQYRKGLGQLPDLDMWVRLCKQYEIHVIQQRLVKFRVRNNEANTSGNRPDTLNRHYSEFIQILKHFLTLEKTEFFKVFPEAVKYNTQNTFNIQYILARLCLEKNQPEYSKLFGMQLLYDLILDENKAAQIKELHHFDYLDLIELSGKHDIFNKAAVISLSKLNNSNTKLRVYARKAISAVINFMK